MAWKIYILDILKLTYSQNDYGISKDLYCKTAIKRKYSKILIIGYRLYYNY